MLGGQITGGSTSVRDGYDKLRIAGAQARTMLVAAAAQKWGVDASACRAAERRRCIGPSGKKATYGELAEAASKLPVPKDVKLKDPKELQLHRQADQAPRHRRPRSTARPSSASTSSCPACSTRRSRSAR